jgi:hypothetical protein
MEGREEQRRKGEGRDNGMKVEGRTVEGGREEGRDNGRKGHGSGKKEGRRKLVNKKLRALPL